MIMSFKLSSNKLLIYMGKIKQINIKNQAYYFFNDMINITDKISYENNGICNIKYITIRKIDDY